MMYTEHQRLYYRDQYKHGCRTLVVSGNGAELLSCDNAAIGMARQLDLAVEEKLVKPGQPILSLSAGWEVINEAKKVGRHVDRWPEIVFGNVDEPNYTKIVPVRQIATEVWGAGYRTGTAIAGYGLFHPAEDPAHGVLAHWLDVWIVLASTWQTDLYRKAHEQTAELWAYWAYPREADRDRYLTGLWCWKYHPKQFLFWAYTHTSKTGILPNGERTEGPDGDPYHMVWPSPDGPVTTPAWEAIAEGIKDHQLLDQLEAKGGSEHWLNELRDSLPEVCPVPPKPVPRTDFAEIRKEVRRRLR